MKWGIVFGSSGVWSRGRGGRTAVRTRRTWMWSGRSSIWRQNYHFGPGKIAMYLKRYHDVTVSQSGVWRILKRLELNRLPSSQRYKRHDQRWKRYNKQLPGHRVQIDVEESAKTYLDSETRATSGVH